MVSNQSEVVSRWLVVERSLTINVFWEVDTTLTNINP
jgi:hypothetical protein